MRYTPDDWITRNLHTIRQSWKLQSKNVLENEKGVPFIYMEAYPVVIDKDELDALNAILGKMFPEGYNYQTYNDDYSTGFYYLDAPLEFVVVGCLDGGSVLGISTIGNKMAQAQNLKVIKKMVFESTLSIPTVNHLHFSLVSDPIRLCMVYLHSRPTKNYRAGVKGLSSQHTGRRLHGYVHRDTDTSGWFTTVCQNGVGLYEVDRGDMYFSAMPPNTWSRLKNRRGTKYDLRSEVSLDITSQNPKMYEEPDTGKKLVQHIDFMNSRGVLGTQLDTELVDLNDNDVKVIITARGTKLSWTVTHRAHGSHWSITPDGGRTMTNINGEGAFKTVFECLIGDIAIRLSMEKQV